MEMMINPAAAARTIITEMLTNLASVQISSIEDIKCSGNWMWAPKLPYEGARLYQAAMAVKNFMQEIGIAIDGGKDSLSMATKVKHPDGNVEIVKSPSQLIISGYVSVPDISYRVTPDIKHPGKTRLMHIDLARGARRLGGSALAQVYSQLGNEVPDVESSDVKQGFIVIQEFIYLHLINSCHDISKGGLITTLLEMCFSGDCGCKINTQGKDEELYEQMFAEEAGWIIEYLPENEMEIKYKLAERRIDFQVLGSTTEEKSIYIANQFGRALFYSDTKRLLESWNETSHQLEKQQIPTTLAIEKKGILLQVDNS